MAINKNALIRYRTIDNCLQNHFKKWTLNDLIEACSNKLYEYEGKDDLISRRTIQLDIQTMRSDKLGYNAPIEVYEKKYYRYSDPDYRITDIPLTENDIDVLTETVELLRQFQDFSLFKELGDIIHRLEDKIYTQRTHLPPIVHLDKNEHLKGLEFLEPIYKAILKKIVLDINYHSFTQPEPKILKFHPILLKEYDNRWYVVGQRGPKKPIRNLALDRILDISMDLNSSYINETINGEEYYKNTIGVTVLRGKEGQAVRVVLKINARGAPYILTKPIHHSQETLEMLPEHQGVIISIKVHLNRELENILMAMGDEIEVLEPLSYATYIKERHLAAARLYD